MKTQSQTAMPKQTTLRLLAAAALCALAPTATANASNARSAALRPPVMPTGSYARPHPQPNVLHGKALRPAQRPWTVRYLEW